MERRWSFRKVLSSVAVAGMLTSMAAVPTISPVNAAVDHQYDLVEMKKDSVLKNGNLMGLLTGILQGKILVLLLKMV